VSKVEQNNTVRRGVIPGLGEPGLLVFWIELYFKKCLRNRAVDFQSPPVHYFFLHILAITVTNEKSLVRAVVVVLPEAFQGMEARSGGGTQRSQNQSNEISKSCGAFKGCGPLLTMMSTEIEESISYLVITMAY